MQALRGLRLGFGNAAQQSRFYGGGRFVNAVDRALDARICPHCLRWLMFARTYAYDSRFVLQQQIQRLTQKGWLLNTGVEPEFVLLRKDEQGKIQPCDPTDTLDKPCYDYKGCLEV